MQSYLYGQELQPYRRHNLIVAEATQLTGTFDNFVESKVLSRCCTGAACACSNCIIDKLTVLSSCCGFRTGHRAMEFSCMALCNSTRDLQTRHEILHGGGDDASYSSSGSISSPLATTCISTWHLGQGGTDSMLEMCLPGRVGGVHEAHSLVDMHGLASPSQSKLKLL